MLGLFPLIISIALFLYGRFLKKKCASTANWPSVKGRITESRWVQSRVGGEYSSGTKQDLSLAYSFQVAGATYASRRISYGPIKESQIAKRFPMGAVVDVYYDPRDPRSCFLEHVKSGSAKWMYGWAIASLLLGLLMMMGGSSKASGATLDRPSAIGGGR